MNAPPPPHDVGAELAVLGAVLLRPEVIEDVERVGLRVRDFFRQVHQAVWQAYVDLRARNEPIDMTTVMAQLDAGGRFEEMGGLSFLAGLPAAVPAVANVQAYAEIVKERSLRRALITQAAELIQAVHADGADAALQSHMSVLAKLEDERVTPEDEPVHVGVEIERIVREAREALDHGAPPFAGVPTGFRDLDRLLGGGLLRGSLTILGGRPSMGKSALALQMASDVAGAGYGAAVWSLEMPETQLGERILAAESRVLYHRIQKRTGLHVDDWPELISAAERADAAHLFLKYRPSMTVDEVGPAVRRLRRRGVLVDLVVIDYLQLMQAPRDGQKYPNREQVIAANTRRLKVLAGELGVAVLMLAQLNRGVEQRADKRPVMSDLRESGAAEQDADNILFVYRDEYYNPNSEMKGVAEVLVRKARGALIGDAKLFWRGELQRFDSLVRDDGWGSA